jgi:hypothetical protein
MRTSRWNYVAAALLAGLAASEAASAKCIDDVDAMAQRQGISSKPPTAAPDAQHGRPITTQDLARSNGVIAPPPIDDRSVIVPPANADPGMQTAPDAKPAPAMPNVGGESRGGAGAEILKPSADAARKQTALQAALSAARASAEHGDEQACREGLSQAKQIAERPSSDK